jgi:hypothetical protein
MSRDLHPDTLAAISDALAGTGRGRPLPAPRSRLAVKLRELDRELGSLLTIEDRLQLDLAIVALGVCVRALAAQVEASS